MLEIVREPVVELLNLSVVQRDRFATSERDSAIDANDECREMDARMMPYDSELRR